MKLAIPVNTKKITKKTRRKLTVEMVVMRRVFVVFCAFLSLQCYGWFLNADQQGERALKAGSPAEAATLFKSQAWRGVAHYRAGEHQQATSDFLAFENEDAHYNRGNALAHLKKYEDAIAAYDRALAMNSDMSDATFNRDLIKKLLEQQKEQQKKDENQEKQENQNEQQDKKDQQQADNNSQEKKGDQQGQDNQDESQQQQEEQNQQKEQEKQTAEQKQQEEQKKQEQQKKQAAKNQQQQKAQQEEREQSEEEQAEQQWLTQIPDDPGGLLRRKFLRDHQRRRRENRSW